MTIIKQLDTDNMTLQNVADILGVSIGMAAKYPATNTNFPHRVDPDKKGVTKKYYVMSDILLWYLRYKGTVRDEDLSEMDKARLEKVQSEASRETLKLKQEQKALLPADQIDLAFGATMAVVNTMREGHGDSCAKKIYDGMTQEQKASIIQESVDALFLKMNDINFIDSLFEDDEVDESE